MPLKVSRDPYVHFDAEQLRTKLSARLFIGSNLLRVFGR